MSLVKQAIIAELQELMPKSTHYSEQYENAKTKPKRDLMMKRLKKNNEKIADLIVALEKINEKEKQEDETAIRDGGVEEESTPAQSAE